MVQTRRQVLARGILLTTLGSGLALARHHRKPRPQPSDTEQWRFQGVYYQRQSVVNPRPMVLHFLTVSLDEPSIRFLVTPPEGSDARLPLRGKKTSQFLAEQKCQIAINGDFFSPWHSSSPWDYYPHIGDPVGVQGDAISEGKRYSNHLTEAKHLTTLWFSKENRVEIGLNPPPDAWNAIGGHHLRLDGSEDDTTLHPRVCAAILPNNKLLFLIVDGRQHGYSEGISLTEVAGLFRDRGALAAINLDGGGSTTLVAADFAGRPQILNSTIDNKIPGRERPVANHLGIFAASLTMPMETDK